MSEKVSVSIKLSVKSKDTIDHYYFMLVQHMYMSLKNAGKVYLGIAGAHIDDVTGQTRESGQVQDVDVKWPSKTAKKATRLTLDYSFGRNPDSFTSVVWAQTEEQQEILGRAEYQRDDRALALEFGFSAWEKGPMVRRRYLKQGIPYILPAFTDFMKDRDYKLSPRDMITAYRENLDWDKRH